MKHKNYSVYFSGIIAIVMVTFTAGCARYSAKPLRTLRSATPPKPTPHVSLAYEVYTKNDCKKYLGCNLISKGIQPVQITINNHSNHPINFAVNSLDLNTIPAETIAGIALDSKANWYLFGGPFVWLGSWFLAGTILDIAWAGHAATILPGITCKVIGLAIGLYTIPLSLIPGIVAHYMEYRTKKKINNDYGHKALRDKTLASYEIINGIVFIPKNDFNPYFSLQVTDLETNISHTLTTKNRCVDIELT